MHERWIKPFVLAALLIGAGLAFGQAGPGDTKKDADPKAEQKQAGDKAGKDAPPKTKLEEMLQQALRNNPDIRVAEAKVAEADAELNRTRLVVMQKVVLYNANLADAKAKVALPERRFERLLAANRAAQHAVSAEEIQAAETELQTAKANLAKVEAELPLLLGTQGQDKAIEKSIEWLRRLSLDVHGDPNKWRELVIDSDNAAYDEGVARFLLGQNRGATAQAMAALFQGAVKPSVQGPMAERIKKALDKPIKVDFPNLEAKSALESLLESVGGIPYNIRLNNHELGEMINLKLGHEVPLGAAFQAYQDVCPPSVRFVVRDYGILVTDDKHVPPGATLLYDLWKSGQDKAKTDKPGERSEAPRKVEGTITKVDPKSGAVSVSVGSDAGLIIGDVLHVYRLGSVKDPAPKYLGQITVVSVQATEAACERPANRPNVVLEVGDRVTNVMPDK